MAQSLAPLKWIIGDDGSKNGTVSLIENFSMFASYSVRFEKNTRARDMVKNF
jgi:hypothetical protein